MNDKTLKTLLIGLIIILMLNSFNNSLGENSANIKEDFICNNLDKINPWLEEDSDLKSVKMIKESLVLPSDEILFKNNSLLSELLSEPDFIPGEILLKFNSEMFISMNDKDHIKTGISSFDSVCSKYDIKSIERLFIHHSKNDEKSNYLKNIYKLIVPDNDDIFKISKEFEKIENVEFAQPNYILKNCTVPNDPYYPSSGSWGQGYKDLYGLHLIQACDAWNNTTGDEDIIVAVIDTGVDYTHEDIFENMWINTDEIPDNGLDDDNDGFEDNIYGADFVGNDVYSSLPDGDPMDRRGHGTHCAGTIAAVGNNGLGIVGINWNSSIMAVKGLDNSGSGTSESLAEAMVWAADNGARVLSNSWGYQVRHPIDPILEDAVDYAYYDRGCIVVMAAGNGNDDAQFYAPQNLPETITVAATDYFDQRAGFSNWGEVVDVCAPGHEILSLRASNTSYGRDIHDNSKYCRASGTSMACPHVAGLAALMLSKNHSLTNDMVRSILRNTTDEISSNVYIGEGRINAYKAILRKPASAKLNPFIDWTNIKGDISINGTAWGEEFHFFKLEYGVGLHPDTWIEITNSTTSIQNGELGSLDTIVLTEGPIILRLNVICNDGIYQDKLTLIVNNEFNTIYVDDDEGPGIDYTSLQEALLSAGKEDRVFTYKGNYTESENYFYIDRSLQLIGENQNNTVIQGTMNIYCDGVYMSKFTINDYYPFGIYLYHTFNNVLEENTIASGDYFGIVLYNSDNNTLINNSIIGKDDKIFPNEGISLVYSSNNNVTYSQISADNHGINLISSTNNKLSNNTISNCKIAGIKLGESSNNSLINNEMTHSGILIEGSELPVFINHIPTNNFLNTKPIYYQAHSNNTSILNDAGQVILVNCSNCSISNLELSQGSYPIQIYYCKNISIVENTISNSLCGINQLNSSGNIISSNNIMNCYDGLYLIVGENNKVSQNNISNTSRYGVVLENSTSLIINNSFNNNTYGIALALCKNGRVEGNEIINNGVGIELIISTKIDIINNEMLNCSLRIRTAVNDPKFNPSVTHFWHNIDTSNTVNGLPIYYLLNQTDIKNPEDAGEIILVNCSRCNISNLMIFSSTVAIEMAYSSNNIITNNNVSDILTYYSDDNIISGNIISNCYSYGIRLFAGNNTIISKNKIINTDGHDWYNFRAMGLFYSNNNTIRNNTITNITGFHYKFIIDENTSGSWTKPAFGILLEDPCHNNTIINNLVSNNLYTIGIKIWHGPYLNYIIDNSITENKRISSHGISLSSSNENYIYNNTVNNNSYVGIKISLSYDNHIFHNVFVNNSRGNAEDPCKNIWDDGYPSGGNYWSDYKGIDADGDGIGDTPYNISRGNNQDLYPLGYFQEIDEEPPIVKITSPEQGLYIKNNKIRSFLLRSSLIIGKIDIEVTAMDNFSGVNRVEFYIDDVLMVKDTIMPYNWTWDKKTPFKFRYSIKVIAYDNESNFASDEITVWRIF